MDNPPRDVGRLACARFSFLHLATLLFALSSPLLAETTGLDVANDLMQKDASQLSLLVPSGVQSQTSIDLVNQALTKDPQQDWEGMIADTTLALQADPHSKIAYYTRSYAEQKKGDFPAAIQDLDASIELDPQFFLAFYERATIEAKTGERLSALADLEQALKIDPKFSKALEDRGVLKTKMGDLPGALADFNSAIALDPKNYKTYLERAFIYDSSGDYRAAVADYTHVITLKPDDISGFNGFAWTYATRPGFNEAERAQAIPYANKACELSQWRQAESIDTLAAAYAANNLFEDAVKWQHLYLQMRPNDQDAQARLQLYLKRQPYLNPPEPPETPEPLPSPDAPAQ